MLTGIVDFDRALERLASLQQPAQEEQRDATRVVGHRAGQLVPTILRGAKHLLSEFQRRGLIEQRGKGLLVREELDVKTVSRSR